MCECGRGGKMRRGMCGTCYQRWLRLQPQSLRDQRTPAERFWAKVEKTETCWMWGGSGTPNGYGQFNLDGRHVYAHRFSYEHTNGPIPTGLTVDHLCGVRSCVNPDHMEIVTRGENTRRGAGPRQCEHCDMEIVPANMPRHVAARHSSAYLGETP